ncbi:coiled-coil domain-containing protein 12 isoform X2 [Pieris napi]|uniref:coiled-coil domain-containing protein 12 isoform X2 n=1 Tax=Pieris napi TaxID=78633 RepID=UPI001FBA5936|nr:coiled-coil domain-containing protein 12 isoform X2 [Pieris napi]
MVVLDTMEGVGNLEEEAQKRKERLKNLKRKNANVTSSSDSKNKDAAPLPRPMFRSYKPQDESLQQAKIQDAEPEKVDEEVKDLVEAGKEKMFWSQPSLSQQIIMIKCCTSRFRYSITCTSKARLGPQKGCCKKIGKA